MNNNYNCRCSKSTSRTSIASPSGNWEYDQLIGARVSVRSMPISNFFAAPNCGDLLTISNIIFRITLDGKVVTIIELLEWPGKFVTWKDIEVVQLNIDTWNPAVCGTFMSGKAKCGYKVSHDAPAEIMTSGAGITVIDQNGNIINNRIVRFVGAEVEDPSTDPDHITDINLNGDIL